MSTISNDIIDRINILRNEFLQNHRSENRILFGIRNILYNIDEMNFETINNHLFSYYTNSNDNLVNLNNINFLTNRTSNIDSINDYINFSLNSFDRNFFNYDLQTDLDTDSDSNSDSEVMSESEEFTFSDDISGFENETEEFSINNNFILNNNIQNNLFNRTVHDFGYTYNNYEILPQNNIDSISNIFNINDFYITNDLDEDSQNLENNFAENIPIVLKLESLNNLKKSKYRNLDEEIKKSNEKCMINLRDFEEDDIVRILPCKHIFIENEIDNWLLNNSHKCPICRISAGEHYAKVN